MIPKIVHYCWFGHGEMPPLVRECIESWHKYMPDWEYRLWTEDNFDINDSAYAREAYAAGKYAFVADYVRLYVLARYGGVYLDTDVEALRPFDPLMDDTAFGGFEGSKHIPVLTCVMASEPGGSWIGEMLEAYRGRHFLKEDGTPDLTTNVAFITSIMKRRGLRTDGTLQRYRDCTVYPVEYFSPRLTTGEYIRTPDTFSDHHGLASWDNDRSWKSRLRKIIGPRNMTRLIKLKRKIAG